MIYLLWFFLAFIAVLDNYRLSGKLFDVNQIFDTTKLHHEHVIVLFILLGLSFYYVEKLLSR
ncbi:MAG: hypothetical protein QW320_11560 [Ignisphaera sp.]